MQTDASFYRSADSASLVRLPSPPGWAWSLDIYEPQRGSVPKPNVVPRLRDYVGSACQHDGNPNGVAANFAHVSIIIGHLVSPTRVRTGRWDATPLGLTSRSSSRPKVGAVRQPWALFQNAVGVPNLSW